MVKPLTILEVHGYNYNYKSDVRKAESGNMKNVKQKCLQSHFLQGNHQGFLKYVEVRLIDKT